MLRTYITVTSHDRFGVSNQLDPLFNNLLTITTKETSNSDKGWVMRKVLQYHDVIMERRKSVPWWRHQMETFSALLALCAGNSSVTGEFPAQCPETRSFDDFFGLRLNKHLCKQSWGWWFETPSRSLWRHCNGQVMQFVPYNMQAVVLWIRIPFIKLRRPQDLLQLFYRCIVDSCWCIYQHIQGFFIGTGAIVPAINGSYDCPVPVN